VRVCFLIPALPAPEAIAEYAGRLDAVVATAAPEGDFDVAVATDWTTTAHLFEVRATRYAFWVDHFAHRRMGTWQAERFAAQLAYDLPVDFIAAAPWVRDTLADLRPEARCELVTSGAREAGGSAEAAPSAGDSAAPGAGRSPAAAHGAGDSAAPGAGRSPAAAPLRVHLAGGADERAAFEAMTEPAAEVALEAAEVVVMLSTVDGVLGAPLAGFRAGATAVVGPAADVADLVRDGENGFVADADDSRGAARSLDLLARDRELLARMREAARATGAAWPTWDQAAEEMTSALERLLAEDPPAAAGWPVRLMGDAIGGAAVFRQEIATLTGEVHRLSAPPPSPARRALDALKRRAKARLQR
jgi:glycosyltransferase involved in cell wall biosynthesis